MQEDTVAMGFSMMNARQKQRFKEELGSTSPTRCPASDVFAVNVFQQRGSVVWCCASFRPAFCEFAS